jgi:hypothetical protein
LPENQRFEIVGFLALLGRILWFDPRREHSSIPTANSRSRRAQGLSRLAVFAATRKGLALYGALEVKHLFHAFSTSFFLHSQGEQADLAEIAARVTEVLADLILMAPPDEQTMMMADVVANLGGMVVEKSQDADPNSPRRSSH